MNDQELDHLLKQADETSNMPPRVGSLADRVRGLQTCRRRRRVRIATSISAMIVVIGSSAWALISLQNRETRLSQPVAIQTQPVKLDVAALRAEIAQLNRETALREAAVERVLDRRAASRSLKRSAEQPARDLAGEIEWQREQAALVLVQQGDRFAKELKLPQPAAVAYRQACDDFPGTHWATVARSRLSEVQ